MGKDEHQYPLQVKDQDGTVIGDYIADLFIEDILIIKIKACKTIADEHIAQILRYLRASNIEHGLLINFGSSKFQIKKYILN
jgi:GxxExxY protein